MKAVIKGTVTRIGEPKSAGTSEVMEIIVNKKYHDQDSGELKGEDNFPVQIWKDKFDEFRKCYETNSRMEITGFINGRLTGDGDNSRCFMNFVARSFKSY